MELLRAVNRGRGTPRPPRQTPRPGNETPWVDARLSPTTASLPYELWGRLPVDSGDGRGTHQPALATFPAAVSSLPGSGGAKDTSTSGLAVPADTPWRGLSPPPAVKRPSGSDTGPMTRKSAHLRLGPRPPGSAPDPMDVPRPALPPPEGLHLASGR